VSPCAVLTGSELSLSFSLDVLGGSVIVSRPFALDLVSAGFTVGMSSGAVIGDDDVGSVVGWRRDGGMCT